MSLGIGTDNGIKIHVYNSQIKNSQMKIRKQKPVSTHGKRWMIMKKNNVDTIYKKNLLRYPLYISNVYFFFL